MESSNEAHGMKASFLTDHADTLLHLVVFKTLNLTKMPVFILKGVICFVLDYLASGLSSEIIMPSLFVEFVFFPT